MISGVARAISTAHNLTDLATQLGVSERTLRRTLIASGYPTDFLMLRDALAQDAPLSTFDHLESDGAVSLLDQADARASKNPVRHNAHYRLDVPDKPLLITFLGDLHIGEAGTDHARIKRDAQLLANLRDVAGPQHILIGMGDYIGGYMRSKTPSNNAQVLDPAEQRQVAEALLSTLRPELVIQGDHDEWHNRHDNHLEWLADHCRRERLRFAQWGAAVEIAHPHGTTRVLARHRFDGSRKVNPYLPHVNLHQTWGPADIVALAHVHSNPGVVPQRSRRETEGHFLAVQSGTYKTFDDYGKKLGVGNGEYGVPSVLLLPGEGEILRLPDLDDAARTLKTLL